MKISTLLFFFTLLLAPPAHGTELFFKTNQAEIPKGAIRTVGYYGPTGTDQGNLYLQVGTWNDPVCEIRGVSQAVGIKIAEQVKTGSITSIYCYIQDVNATFQDTQFYWLSY